MCLTKVISPQVAKFTTDPLMYKSAKVADDAMDRLRPKTPEVKTYDVAAPPLPDVPQTKRRTQPTLLTGSSLATPATAAAPGVSLLGG